MGTRATYRVIEEWSDDRPEAKVKKGQVLKKVIFENNAIVNCIFHFI